MRRLTVPVGVLSLVVLLSAAAGQDKQPVKPVMTWAGKLAGDDKEDLMKLAPANALVTDEKTFTKLWKAWRTEEKVPPVDFARQFVLVQTSKGPNTVNAAPMLDARGDLTVKAQATLIGGPGFGYALLLMDRKGVKTVFGKPLPAGE